MYKISYYILSLLYLESALSTSVDSWENSTDETRNITHYQMPVKKKNDPQNQVNDLQNRVDELQNQVNELQGQVDKSRKQGLERNSKISELINRLREKDTKISKQESTIKDLASRINELERKTEEQNKELELMKSMKDEDYIRWVEAAKSGDAEVIQFFIDKRIDVNISRSNYPALLLAAENGHEKIVEMLLKAGADVNYCYFFSGTALCRAASKAHVCVVNTLLKKRSGS